MDDINFLTNNNEKLNKIKSILKSYKHLALAYSGGTDSTLLLKFCKDFLNDDFEVFIAKSPIHSSYELKTAIKILEDWNIKYQIINTNEISNMNFLRNLENRCYICKKLMFSEAISQLKNSKILHIIEGTNLTDLKYHRPGYKALKELNIKSPFVEAGFTQDDIDYFSRYYNLPTKNKASNACLATRFPTNIPISLDILKKVEKIEDFLLENSFKQFRARYHGNLIRIELDEKEQSKIFSSNVKEPLVKLALELGFKHITIDLKPYQNKG